MALQALSSHMTYPGITRYLGNVAAGITNITILDAAGEYQAVVFRAREAMTLSHIGIRLQSVTGSPTAEIRVETVDATTGHPTGTLWATDTNVTTGTLTTTFTVHALTASASISAGDVFAVKFLYQSGTQIQIAQFPWQGQPFSVVNTGTPAIATSTNVPWGLGSSTTSFYKFPSIWPINTWTFADFNNTGDARRALRFQTPFKCRAVGASYGRVSNSAGDFDLCLRDDAGSVLNSSTSSFDASQWPATGGGTGETLMRFANPVELSPGTWYRLSIEPTSATNVRLHHVVVTDQAIRSGLPCGTNAHLATYTTAGGWVDTATDTVPLLDIIVDQLDDGVSTGGARQKVYGG